MSLTFSTYQRSTGLNCLSGCGSCCLNPEIEASVLEMIPMALQILDENKLEYWLDRLETSLQQSCLMYRPLSPDGTKGSCGAYEGRPSVCRMFGVSGYFDKHQRAKLSICKRIKEHNPELAAKKDAEASITETPMLQHWTLRLTQLDPALIQDRMPINEALKRALQKVALYAQYQAT